MRKDHRFIGVILLAFSLLFALHQSGITTWAEVLLPDDPGNEQGVDILLDAEDEDGEEEAEEALAQTSQMPEEDGAGLFVLASEELIEDGTSEPVYTTASPAFMQTDRLDGVTITVSADPGTFPAGSTLSVKRVTLAQRREAQEAVEEVRDEGVNVSASYTFDIKVLDANGVELQPTDGKSVQVSFANEEVADENLDTQVYHLTEETTVQGELTAEALEVDTVQENTAVVETDGFSLYVVEFTYDQKKFYMHEGDTCSLKKVLLPAVGLTGTVTNVEETKNLSVTETEDNADWIISLRGVDLQNTVDLDEKLTLTIDSHNYDITIAKSKEHENAFGGTEFNDYSVSVSWNGTGLDEGRFYAKNISSITFKMQRSTDNIVWQDVHDREGEIKLWEIPINFGLSSRDASKSIDQELPRYTPSGTAYHYRAIEVGYTPKNADMVRVDNYAAATIGSNGVQTERIGAYRVKAVTSDTGTTLENHLLVDKVSLNVNWVDYSNREGDRPSALRFGLFDQGGNNISDDVDIGNWNTAIGNNDVWSKVVTYPVYDISGNLYRYGMREVGKDQSLTIYEAEAKITSDSTSGVSGVRTYFPNYYYDTTFTFSEMFTAIDPGDGKYETPISLTVTNTRTEDLSMIDTIKVLADWNDRNNVFGDRPDEVTYELHASYMDENGVKQNVGVKEENGIQYMDFGDSSLDGSVLSVVTAENTGMTWINLPKYMPGQVGKEITYSVGLRPVTGYTTKVGNEAKNEGVIEISVDTMGGKITFTNTQQTTSLTATVSWPETAFSVNNVTASDGTPRTIKETAYVMVQRTSKDNPTSNDWESFNALPDASGVAITSKAVDKTAANKTVSWSGLPMADKSGNRYHYRAVEELFLDTDEPTNHIAQARFFYLAPVLQDTVSVQECNTDAVKYKSMTSYNSEKNCFETKITNSRYVGTITYKKVWDDHNNQDGQRPKTIKVTLKLIHAVNGYKPYWNDKIQWQQTVTVSEAGPDQKVGTADDWTYTWSNLPFCDLIKNELKYQVDEASNAYGDPSITASFSTYTIKQWDLSNYRSDWLWLNQTEEGHPNVVMTNGFESNNGQNRQDPVFTSVNSYIPETVSVSASSAWEDQNNKDGSRGAVTLTLMRQKPDGTLVSVSRDQDGRTILPKTIGANVPATGQVVRWDNLPKNSAGKTVIYSVLVSGKGITGNADSGYQVVSSKDTDEGDGFTFALTMKHNPQRAPVKEDPKTAPETKPDKPTPTPAPDSKQAEQSAPTVADFSTFRLQRAKTTTSSLQIEWKKMNGAKRYVIYGSRGNQAPRKIATVSAKKTTYTQKHLKKGSYYTYYVVALDAKGRSMATSPSIQAATKGGKSGNPIKIKVSYKSLTLKKGKSKTIKVKVTNMKGKRLKNYGAIRFESSNPAVATVTGNGKIKAVGKGKCKVYVYAQDGTYRTVSVKVK